MKNDIIGYAGDGPLDQHGAKLAMQSAGVPCESGETPGVAAVAAGFGDLIRCPSCGIEWPNDCEQGVSVALYKRCIVCAPSGEMHIGEICAARSRMYLAAGHPDPYSPNGKAQPDGCST